MSFISGTLARRAAVALLGGALVTGCASDGRMSKTGKGAAIGAATGAVVGLVTGDDSTERRQHALIGAGIGALAGTAIGAYMDAQERKLKERLAGTGVDVVRQGDEIVLSMPSNITFDTGSADVKPDFHRVLGGVAVVLAEYEKTTIDVAGHTDSRGAWEFNQALSEQRAAQVGSVLADEGVQQVRIAARGFGESRPVASNETVDGRSANRRVELKLVPITRG